MYNLSIIFEHMSAENIKNHQKTDEIQHFAAEEHKFKNPSKTMY